MGQASELPFRPFVTARTACLVAVAWTPLVGGVEALRSLSPGPSRWSAIAGCLVWLGCGCGSAVVGLRSPSRLRAAAWTAAGMVVAAVLVSLMRRADPANLAPIAGRVGVLPVAAVAVSVLWSALLAASLHRPARSASHEATDWVIVASAAWLVVPRLAIHVAPSLDDARYPPGGSAVVDLAALVLLPVVVALVSALRVLDRRNWLRLVEDGRVAGWWLLERACAQETLPRLIGSAEGAVTVLVREPRVRSPYRDNDFEPVAVVGPARAESEP